MKNDLVLFRGGFWSPMRNISNLQRAINRFFNDYGWSAPNKVGAVALALSSACKIKEDEKQYLMSLALPGVNKEDIKIELADRELVVSGERRNENQEDKQSWHIIERYAGSFQRVFTLPSSVNAAQIQATFENGVLRLVIPKADSETTRRIPISEKKTEVDGSLPSGAKKSEAKSKEHEASVRIA